MANGTVTRAVVYARAYAWVANGTTEDGQPMLEKVGGVEFMSTKPTKRIAYRALKNAGYSVQNSNFVTFEVEREAVYAQSLDTFIEHGVEVNRLPNGRVAGAVD